MKALKLMENWFVSSLKNPNKVTTNEVRIRNKYKEAVIQDEDLVVEVNLIMITLEITSGKIDGIKLIEGTTIEEIGADHTKPKGLVSKVVARAEEMTYRVQLPALCTPHTAIILNV